MITNINRAWAFNPGIITISSTDTVLDCLEPGYLIAQADTISILNNGDFEFKFGDLVALSASDSSELCKFEGENFSTMILSSGAGSSSQIISTHSFTSSTSGAVLPVPNGTTYFYYELSAGGGGGGGAVDGGGSNTFAAGGGGGSGGFIRGYFFKSDYSFITGNITYVIGAGGSGSIGSTTGISGGNSSITIPDLISVSNNGGAGGVGSTGASSTSTAFIASGAGGNIGGGNGFPGSINAGAVCSGAGGSNPVGSGGRSIITTGIGVGGTGSGCGGSGAALLSSGSLQGGPGRAGLFSVTFFGLLV